MLHVTMVRLTVLHSTYIRSHGGNVDMEGVNMIVQQGGVNNRRYREEDEKKMKPPKRGTPPCYPHRELEPCASRGDHSGLDGKSEAARINEMEAAA